MGGTVAISTRDHPETLPEGVVHAGDDWSAVAAAGPDLAVFDNLVFEEPRGRELRRWDGDVGRYVNVSAGLLESVLNDLDVSGHERGPAGFGGDGRSATGWRGWMTRHAALPMVPYPEAESDGLVARRQWSLEDTQYFVNFPYRYREGRLVKPCPGDWPRKLEVKIFTPAAEALLALTAEYAAVRFDSRDPEDPRGLNQRYDMCHEILEAFGGTAGPARAADGDGGPLRPGQRTRGFFQDEERPKAGNSSKKGNSETSDRGETANE